MNVFINKDKVLIVNMELANAIGLNRAIVLNQINYWIEKSNHVFEGKKWIYNSFESWHDQFQFWSLNTVKRIFKSLEKDGLVISGTYNKAAFDKTKWLLSRECLALCIALVFFVSSVLMDDIQLKILLITL